MVLSCVASNSEGSICDNTWFNRYMQVLNEKHRLLYSLKQVRLTNLCSDSCRHEFSFIVQEGYVELTDTFLSSDSKFLWEPVRQKLYIAIFANPHRIIDHQRWLLVHLN